VAGIIAKNLKSGRKKTFFWKIFWCNERKMENGENGKEEEWLFVLSPFPFFPYFLLLHFFSGSPNFSNHEFDLANIDKY
jgi:hypothetical protein